MAKKPKQFRKKKINYLDFLKSLTKWISSRYKDEQKLDHMIKTYELTNQIIFLRMASYAYNNPHIIWYLNKYFNHLFDFNTYNLKNLIYNICYVFDINHHNSSSKFFYVKSQDLKDNNKKKVKGLIKDYFEIIKKKHINDIELNHYYNLFNRGVIKEEELEKLNKMINGDEAIALKLDPVETEESNYSEQDIKDYFEKCRTRELPENIKKFSEQLKSEKPDRNECQKCKLYDSPMVVLDTNKDDFGPVHFAFVALNPGKDEKIYDKPLTGNAGYYHRSRMFYFPEDISWLLTNIMLCFTSNQKKIGKTEDEILNVASNCKGFVARIFKQFPAYYYIPIGKPAAAMFGIKGSVTENSGQLFNIGNANVIPLVHPSGAMQYRGKLESAFDYGFNRLYELANQLSSKQVSKPSKKVESNSNNQIDETISQINQKNQQQNTQQKQSKSNDQYLNNIPNEKIIHNYDQIKQNKLTFFDSFNLDNKNMLLIYLDENGKKFYMLEELKVPLYIKYDTSNCDILIDDPDQVCYVNGFSKNKVLKSVRENMEINKKSVVENNQ